MKVSVVFVTTLNGKFIGGLRAYKNLENAMRDAFQLQEQFSNLFVRVETIEFVEDPS